MGFSWVSCEKSVTHRQTPAQHRRAFIKLDHVSSVFRPLRSGLTWDWGRHMINTHNLRRSRCDNNNNNLYETVSRSTRHWFCPWGRSWRQRRSKGKLKQPVDVCRRCRLPKKLLRRWQINSNWWCWWPEREKLNLTGNKIRKLLFCLATNYSKLWHHRKRKEWSFTTTLNNIKTM